MRTRDHGLLTNAASLLLCGLLAGLVVAAAAFPALAMSGLTAKAGADTFEQMPADFDVVPSPQLSNIYASDGTTLLASAYDENRRDVPLSDVAMVMQQAMVAAEDKNFYKHHGVDLKGVARAFVKNQQGDDKQGASTLTMQYIRQVIQYSAKTPKEVVEATEQTPARKLREMKYAIALEKKLNKQQILERYLNIAAFGEGAYGIWAASQVYFQETPAELTLPQASLLASLVKAPSIYDPARATGKPKALYRRNTYTLPNMQEMGFINQVQLTEAIAAEPEIHSTHPPQGCTEVQRPELGAGFFCDYLLRWWAQQKDFGADEYERENRLKSGGYKIITSLDLNTQKLAYKYAMARPGGGKTDVNDLQAVLLAAVQPGTGRVQALATNRVFSNDQSGNLGNTNPYKKGQKGNRPNTAIPLITGGPDVAGYQAGSVFKIFTTVAALENGYPLNYTINAGDVAQTHFIVGQDSPAACPGTHFYCPTNAGHEAGNYTMWGGFGKSVNTYYVPLEERVGAQKVVEVAKRLGMQFRASNDATYANDPALAAQWGAFTLGVSASTPLDMANAWATLAADGKYCEPTPVNEIDDRDGKKVPAGDPHCKDVVSPDVARGAMDAARCPVGDSSSTTRCVGATAGGLHGIVGKPLAGKTGTTDDEKTATMTITTKQLAISGYIVDPDWPTHPNVGDHPIINNSVAYLMKDALAGQPSINFTPPSDAIVNGSQANMATVPTVKCATPDAAKSTLSKAGFKPFNNGTQVASDCPAGSVAGTDPAGKSPKGSSVEILISKGPGNGSPVLPNTTQPTATRPTRRG